MAIDNYSPVAYHVASPREELPTPERTLRLPAACGRLSALAKPEKSLQFRGGASGPRPAPPFWCGPRDTRSPHRRLKSFFCFQVERAGEKRPASRTHIPYE